MLIARSTRLLFHFLLLIFGCMLATDLPPPFPLQDHTNKCCLNKMCCSKQGIGLTTHHKTNAHVVCQNGKITFLCSGCSQSLLPFRLKKEISLLPSRSNVDHGSKFSYRKRLKLQLRKSMFWAQVSLLCDDIDRVETRMDDMCNCLQRPSSSEDTTIFFEKLSVLNILYLLKFYRNSSMFDYDNCVECLCSRRSHSEPESFRIYKGNKPNKNNVIERKSFLSNFNTKSLKRLLSKAENRRGGRILVNGQFTCLQKKCQRDSRDVKNSQIHQKFVNIPNGFDPKNAQFANNALETNNHHLNHFKDHPKHRYFPVHVTRVGKFSSRLKRQLDFNKVDVVSKSLENERLGSTTNVDDYFTTELPNKITLLDIISNVRNGKFPSVTESTFFPGRDLNERNHKVPFTHPQKFHLTSTSSMDSTISQAVTNSDEKLAREFNFYPNIGISDKSSEATTKSRASSHPSSKRPPAMTEVSAEDKLEIKGDRNSGNNDILITPLIPNNVPVTQDSFFKNILTTLHSDGLPVTADSSVSRTLSGNDLDESSIANTLSEIDDVSGSMKTKSDGYGQKGRGDPVTVSEIFRQQKQENGAFTEQGENKKTYPVSLSEASFELTSKAFIPSTSTDYASQTADELVVFKGDISSPESTNNVFTLPDSRLDVPTTVSRITLPEKGREDVDSKTTVLIQNKGGKDDVTNSVASSIVDDVFSENAKPPEQLGTFTSSMYQTAVSEDGGKGKTDEASTTKSVNGDFSKSLDGETSISILNKNGGITSPLDKLGTSTSSMYPPTATDDGDNPKKEGKTGEASTTKFINVNFSNSFVDETSTSILNKKSSVNPPYSPQSKFPDDILPELPLQTTLKQDTVMENGPISAEIDKTSEAGRSDLPPEGNSFQGIGKGSTFSDTKLDSTENSLQNKYSPKFPSSTANSESKKFPTKETFSINPASAAPPDLEIVTSYVTKTFASSPVDHFATEEEYLAKDIITTESDDRSVSVASPFLTSNTEIRSNTDHFTVLTDSAFMSSTHYDATKYEKDVSLTEKGELDVSTDVTPENVIFGDENITPLNERGSSTPDSTANTKLHVASIPSLEIPSSTILSGKMTSSDSGDELAANSIAPDELNSERFESSTSYLLNGESKTEFPLTSERSESSTSYPVDGISKAEYPFSSDKSNGNMPVVTSSNSSSKEADRATSIKTSSSSHSYVSTESSDTENSFTSELVLDSTRESSTPNHLSGNTNPKYSTENIVNPDGNSIPPSETFPSLAIDDVANPLTARESMNTDETSPLSDADVVSIIEKDSSPEADVSSTSEEEIVNTDEVLIRTDRDVLSQNSQPSLDEDGNDPSENTAIEGRDDTTNPLIRTEREIVPTGVESLPVESTDPGNIDSIDPPEDISAESRIPEDINNVDSSVSMSAGGSVSSSVDNVDSSVGISAGGSVSSSVGNVDSSVGMSAGGSVSSSVDNVDSSVSMSAGGSASSSVGNADSSVGMSAGGSVSSGVDNVDSSVSVSAGGSISSGVDNIDSQEKMDANDEVTSVEDFDERPVESTTSNPLLGSEDSSDAQEAEISISQEDIIPESMSPPVVDNEFPKTMNVEPPTEILDINLNGDISTDLQFRTSTRETPSEDINVGDNSSPSFTENTQTIDIDSDPETFPAMSPPNGNPYPESGDDSIPSFTTDKNIESTTISRDMADSIPSFETPITVIPPVEEDVSSFDDETQNTEPLAVETQSIPPHNIRASTESSAEEEEDVVPGEASNPIDEENSITSTSVPSTPIPKSSSQSSNQVTPAGRSIRDSTVSPTESPVIPFHFTIDADYDELVGSRKEEFEDSLSKQLVVAMRVPSECLQNLQVSKGSIEVNFELVPNPEYGHLADEDALKAAAEELKRRIDNGQLTINDLNGNMLVVIPMDPPTTPPPVFQSEHTTLILGVIIGAFILTVISVVITAIVVKRKAMETQRLSPIEEARRQLPSYGEIPFKEALFLKGHRNKMMMGKYCYRTGQWLGPGPEPIVFQPPDSVVYTPPSETEIRSTPRPPTAVRERLRKHWELDWDSMVFSR